MQSSIGMSPPTPPTSVAPTPVMPATREITIDAKNGVNSTRVSLGPMRKGQTIMFQYVRGKWTAFPRDSAGSPDDLVRINSNVLLLRFCEADDGIVVDLG